MLMRKCLTIACLILCGVFCGVTPLKSAEDATPAAQECPPPPKTVVRMYDIRSLVAASDDFPFETSPHAPAFVIPASEQAGEGAPYFGNGSRVYLNGTVGPGKSEPTYAEKVDELMKTITNLIDPETWREAGGTMGSMREMNGILIITQSEAAQKQIAAFIQQMSDLRTRPIRTTARWLLLTPAEMEKLLKPATNRDPGAPREVDAAALEKLPPSVARFHAELPGHNGQTLHALSGHEKSVTISATMCVGTGAAGYTPVHANVADGIAIQITPIVDFERKTAVLTLFSTFNAGQEQGPTMTVRAFATTQPSPGDASVNSTASAAYHEIGTTVQEFRTTLRMPLNTPVICGAMTLTPGGKESDPRELVLIVCVHARG